VLRLYIRLLNPAAQVLIERARAERRHPSDEAALIVERALEMAAASADQCEPLVTGMPMSEPAA
jgi:hypothetical protein